MGETVGGAYALYMRPIARMGSLSFDEIITRNGDYLDQVDDDIMAGLGGAARSFPPVVMPGTVTRDQALFIVGSPRQIVQYLSARGTEHINVVDGTANISFRLATDKASREAAGIAKGVLAVAAYPLGVLAAGGIKAALSPSSYDADAVMRRRRRIERGKIDPAVVQVACSASNALAAPGAAPPAAAGPAAGVGGGNSHTTLQQVVRYLQGSGFA